MEPIKINVSVPFRADGTAEDHPGCIRSFSNAEINAYMAAIEKEITAAAVDADEYQVQEIDFTNGSITHLGMDAPKKLMKLIRSSFQVIDKAKITMRATPSALDFFTLNMMRQLGCSFLTIELPTLEEEGLRAAGYVTGRQRCIEALDSCFQNGFRKFGCELDPKYFISADGLRGTLTEILARKPQSISFARAPREEYQTLISELLSGAGYVRGKASDTWFNSAEPAGRSFRNQLGFGPYAISVFDAQAVRTTGDFNFYLAHSDDFEALVMNEV